jgi:hypothetical protein
MRIEDPSWAREQRRQEARIVAALATGAGLGLFIGWLLDMLREAI